MSVYNSVIFKDLNLTPRVKQAYHDAYNLANDLGHVNVNNLHVFYGCVKNSCKDFTSFLFKNGLIITDDEIISVIEKCKETNNDKFFANKNSDPWHKEVADCVKEANEISLKLNQHYIGIEHIMYSMITTSSYVLDIMKDFIFDLGLFKKGLKQYIYKDYIDEEYVNAEYSDDIHGYTNTDQEEETSLLDELDLLEPDPIKLPDFITSLNKQYIEGKLPEVYGRDEEVDMLIETISKKNKCNAILTGEAGVGKTSVVESLCYRICKGQVPSNLLGVEIFNVNLGSMIAGTQYRGQFEQKFKNLLELVKDNPYIILFFDEIHTIFGAGGNQEGGIDAANMLKPLLARGEIKCIGATTKNEYNKIFSKDGAMKRRFLNIEIDETSKKDTQKILFNCKNKYEKFHNVKFSKPIINYIVDLSDSLISHKKFPDKAFDIMDQVGARVKIKNSAPCNEVISSHKELVNILATTDPDISEVKAKFGSFLEELKQSDSHEKKPINVKKSDVAEVICDQGKVSIDQVRNTSSGFSSFLTRMRKEVFGQDHALNKVYDLLSCAKAGLCEENKPLSSLLFVGPTSVGKTHTAKKIAKNFFGNERAILQVNMSELYDKTGVSKLIGSNSGYVGYEEGGMLTKFVKENPNCVVLFDEIEKADPQVLNILLHLLDEGYIEDNRHEKVDFSKTIVILTSNIGHDKANQKSMGFVQEEDRRTKSYEESVKKNIKPELLARINEVITFNDLIDSDIKNIINSELNKIKLKLSTNSINVKFNNDAVDLLFCDIKAKDLHARDIKNYIRENVKVPVSKMIVKNSKISEISIKNVDNRLNVC